MTTRVHLVGSVALDTAEDVFSTAGKLLGPYLEGEHGSDQPGRFIGWLHRHEAVYGWVFEESWHDIGNYEQLLEADNRLRAAAGLPVRETYVPD